MKTKIVNYVFNPALRTVTLSDYSLINLENLLLIINVTDNVQLYSLIAPSLGCTVANNVITLTCDTTAMSGSDKLLIYYDDPAREIPTASLMQTLTSSMLDALGFLRRITQLMKPLGIVTGSGSNRLSIDVNAITTLPTLATVTTVSTVGTVTNQTNIGGITAFSMQKSTAHNAYANSVRSKITFS